MITQQIASQASAYVTSALASPSELLAIFAATVAGGLQVSSSFVKTMVPLRWLAVLSNCGFLVYGVLHPSFVMALMHGVLLPINCVRLREMSLLTRRVKAATSNNTDRSGVWLRPYMKSSKRKAGETLFRKGDEAEHLYILVEGRVDFPEIERQRRPGRDLRRDRVLLARAAPHPARALRRGLRPPQHRPEHGAPALLPEPRIRLRDRRPHRRPALGRCGAAARPARRAADGVNARAGADRRPLRRAEAALLYRRGTEAARLRPQVASSSPSSRRRRRRRATRSSRRCR